MGLIQARVASAADYPTLKLYKDGTVHVCVPHVGSMVWSLKGYGPRIWGYGLRV
jgi:hypothetical protein